MIEKKHFDREKNSNSFLWDNANKTLD